MPLRVGIVGAGYIGVRHAEAWRRLGVELHVYSRDAHRRADAAARCGAHDHDRLDTLIDAVDVMDVCTPTDTHARITLAAAAAGRHVVCEKPLARTLDAAVTMVQACREAGVGLYAAHVVRFSPAYARARATTAAGAQPVALHLHRASAVPDWATWLHQDDRSGGILCDFMIHDFDAARWIAGEVVEVFACLARNGDRLAGGGTPVEARVALRHAGGATSHVSGSWLPPPAKFRTSFEIATGSGILRHDSDLDTDGIADPMTTQLAEFLDAITTGTTPRVTGDDGLAALAIALAAIESAETGRPVTPPA